MTNGDIAKLVSRLSKSLATKEDIKELSTKDDLRKLENRLESRIEEVDSRLGRKIVDLGINLGKKIDELNVKADTIMQFADEGDKTTADHEKRLKRIEAVPVIAHQIKKSD